MSLKNKLKVAALSILLASGISAASAWEQNFGNVTLDAKGLLIAGGTGGDGYAGAHRASFLQLGASTNVNQVKAGVSATYYFNRIRLFGHDYDYDAGFDKIYVYLSSPELGTSQLGYTTSVIDEYFLNAQGYRYKQTFHLPYVTHSGWGYAGNHRNTFRYDSNKNNYFDYAVSVSLMEKLGATTSSQVGASVNWKYQETADYKVKVHALAGLVVTKDEFSSYENTSQRVPLSVGASVVYKDNLKFGLTAYYAPFRSSTNYDKKDISATAHNLGFSGFAAYSPLANTNVYGSFTFDLAKFEGGNTTTRTVTVGASYEIPVFNNKAHVGAFAEYSNYGHSYSFDKSDNSSYSNSFGGYTLGVYGRF